MILLTDNEIIMKLWLMLDNYNGKKAFWNYRPYKWHTKIFRFSLDLLTVYINGIWDDAVKPWPNIHLACGNQIGLFFHAMGTEWFGALVGHRKRRKTPIPVGSSSLSRGPAQNQHGETATDLMRRLGQGSGRLRREVDWRPSEKNTAGRTMIAQSSHRSESAIDWG